MLQLPLNGCWFGRCGMERDHEAETQESSRHSAWQAGWPGAQRGQTPRQSHKRPQGWAGKKPQEAHCRPPQCTTSPPRPPQKIIEVIALIRARFGGNIIGLGHQGLRFAGVPDAHTA
jgi:hypothetical protein